LNRTPDRTLPFKTDAFMALVKQLNNQDPESSEELLCMKALQSLIDGSWLIPLGRIHFSMLAKPEWKGWQLSALNFLDLSQLHLEK
jgi:oligopeptide transport system substrate-binding protein